MDSSGKDGTGPCARAKGSCATGKNRNRSKPRNSIRISHCFASFTCFATTSDTYIKRSVAWKPNNEKTWKAQSLEKVHRISLPVSSYQVPLTQIAQDTREGACQPSLRILSNSRCSTDSTNQQGNARCVTSEGRYGAALHHAAPSDSLLAGI